MVTFPDTTLFFDIETHSITERFSMTPPNYFRLGGYSWGESSEVTITDDYEEMIRVLRKADVVVGHNVHGFDLSVLFDAESVEALEMAQAYKVFCTFIHATLVNPAPYSYVNSEGRTQLSNEPSKARKWFSLDNQAFQFGVPGKLMKLSELAKDFSTIKSKGRGGHREVWTPDPGVCCGYGHIPTDLPVFREYLRYDVLAARHVARELLNLGPLDAYAWRAQLSAGIDAQTHRNGMLVEQGLVDSRIEEQDLTAAYALHQLHEDFGFPVQGKKPIASKEGKEALLAALKAAGVDEDRLDRTDKGNLSFGGDSVKKAAERADNPEARSLAEVVAMLAGQRTLPQLVKASLYPDGKVHPEISPLQKSGRKSITEPGLTIFDSNHKDYFLPDSDDHVLVEFDLSNADARGVAAMSGDRAFAVRFQPGQDGHMINAIAAWGAGLVATDPAGFRQRAKIPGYGWSYRGGPAALAKQTGTPVEEMKVFVDGMNKAFRGVVRWQDACVAFARKHGYIDNPWGRRMPVDIDRVYTQAPALRGQSWTTELITDALIKMPIRVLRMVKITIHDAILFSIPEASLEADRALIIRCMESVHHPRGGQRIEFPVSSGPAGKNWKNAEH